MPEVEMFQISRIDGGLNMARPGIPVEKPKRREIPEITDPFAPAPKRIPVVPVPVKSPIKPVRGPVPIR